jgi:hypothetical protein
MLPQLNENGALPPGVHAASWTEIEKQFGTRTRARVRAMATLRRLHELARRTGFLRKFYAFGSFVSAVAEPRDIDVLLLMAQDFRIEDCPSDCAPLFSHLLAEARYGASVFWFREVAMPKDVLHALQLKRDGTVRGILEVA